jgi:hypothetical protein
LRPVGGCQRREPALARQASARRISPGSPSGLPLGVVAIALRREAILAGYPVQFVTAMTLGASFAKVHAERRLEERITNLSKPRLSIVDELGYLPLELDAAHLFFQLVSRRYEKGAMLITSNRTISEWGTVFGDAVVAASNGTSGGPRARSFSFGESRIR